MTIMRNFVFRPKGVMNQNEELYSRFLDWLTIGHSPETVQSYRWGLKMFVDWCDGTEKDIVDVKEHDIVEYALYLKEVRRVKNSTQASYFCSLRTFWRWLYRQNLVKFNDDVIPMPKDNDKEHYPFVLPDEVKKMQDIFDDFYPDQLRDKAVLTFFYATGVRLSELISINVSEIDLGEKKAVCKTFKRTNHKREIYWDDNTNEILKKWIEIRDKLETNSRYKSDALFITMSHQKYGQRIGKHAIQKMFREVRKLAGIEKKITAHSFRHGFGKRAVEHDVHPRHLQLMLGHAKLNTTMFYMGVTNEEIERVYRQKMIA